MDKDLEIAVKVLRNIVEELHCEAQRAYWSKHNHCGSDWSPECDGCHTFDQCEAEVLIASQLDSLDIALE